MQRGRTAFSLYPMDKKITGCESKGYVDLLKGQPRRLLSHAGYPVTPYPMNSYKIWAYAAPVNYSIQVTAVHFDVGSFLLLVFFV